MDDDFDDWEMDDFEEEAFDEDVYDHAELELTAPAEVASYDDTEDLGLFDQGGTAAGAPTGRSDTGGERMGWSAWDVGTVFALGGWLADHHADRTAQQVAAALAERDVGRPASGSPLGAAHPPPPTGYPYLGGGATLGVEDAVDQGALFDELVRAKVRGQDLMIQADGPVDLDRTLVLIISAVPGSSGPRFWVVAEEHPDGFSSARLIPVFERSTGSGVAIFATDHAHEAVDAAVWACQREGVPLHEFHVTLRQP